MSHERYSIEVNDESVLIYGDLTIDEGVAFLDFFESLGFNRVTLGSENSSISLMKKSIPEIQEESRKIEHEESEKFYENLYKKKGDECDRLSKRNSELESLIKEVMKDKSIRMENLEKENQELLKRIKLKDLEDYEELKKFTMGFAYVPPKSSKKYDEEPNKKNE